VQLRFIAAEVLEQVLQSATPSGDKGVNAAWWRLRMEVLRVMHRPDEFELVALDYCVTYEVSPPSWDSARCEYKPLQSDGSYVAGHTIIGEAFRDSMPSSLGAAYGDTQMPSMNSQMTNVSMVELAGQILGDATEALDTLENRLLGADVMVISCARLIRIDFSAAGTLLNWVTARQGRGPAGPVQRSAPPGGCVLQCHRHQRACARDSAHRLNSPFSRGFNRAVPACFWLTSQPSL
jgi:ABC-type transporter Mla MlaB component